MYAAQGLERRPCRPYLGHASYGTVADALSGICAVNDEDGSNETAVGLLCIAIATSGESNDELDGPVPRRHVAGIDGDLDGAARVADGVVG